MADEKNAVGRPLEGIETLPESWYNQLLELYKEGASDAEIKALIYEWRGSFSNDLWDRWIKDIPEFSETIKTGKIISEGWWHKAGRTALRDKEFSYTGWYMQMKNRFGWKDTQAVDHSGNISNLPPQIVFTDEEDAN